MKTLHAILGWAGLALIAAAPAYAAAPVADDPRVASPESGRQVKSDGRRLPEGHKRKPDAREDARGYGYGYERRQQDQSGDDPARESPRHARQPR